MPREPPPAFPMRSGFLTLACLSSLLPSTASELPWLDAVTTPPPLSAEIVAEAGPLAPLLADDAGKPITTSAAWATRRGELLASWKDLLGPMPPRPTGGFTVIATAGSDEKLAAARRHGADAVINYRAGGFREQVLALTGGRGADVIFDPVGGAVFDESLRCVAPDGRIIPMGFASGAIPTVPANIVLVKNVDVIGLYWGHYLGWGRVPPPPGDERRVRDAMSTMLDWCVQGRLAPETYRVFLLDEWRAALATLSAREVIGRVALRPLREEVAMRMAGVGR